MQIQVFLSPEHSVWGALTIAQPGRILEAEAGNTSGGGCVLALELPTADAWFRADICNSSIK